MSLIRCLFLFLVAVIISYQITELQHSLNNLKSSSETLKQTKGNDDENEQSLQLDKSIRLVTLVGRYYRIFEENYNYAHSPKSNTVVGHMKEIYYRLIFIIHYRIDNDDVNEKLAQLQQFINMLERHNHYMQYYNNPPVELSEVARTLSYYMYELVNKIIAQETLEIPNCNVDIKLITINKHIPLVIETCKENGSINNVIRNAGYLIFRNNQIVA